MQENIDTNEFIKAIKEANDVASLKLGEYIRYRQQIVEALKIFSKKNGSAQIHNLFLQEKILNNNLWLLDDKFLSYYHAMNGEKIKTILKPHGSYGAEKKAQNLAMFYSNKEDEDSLTCVLIDIKPFCAGLKEKLEGLFQVRTYANIFYKNNPKVKAFWIYLITEIDDNFQGILEREEYNPIFSSAEGHKIFTKYFPREDPPIYLEIACVDALIQDADARNKDVTK